MRTTSCCYLFLLLAACGVQAIFEEQAGENDWHAEFIGQVFSSHALGRDRTALATTSNVVAVISSTSGDIVWRQILHTTDQLQHIAVLSKPAAVLTLSSAGSILRAWQQSDGALLWEQHMAAQATAQGSLSNVSALAVVSESTAGSSQKVAVTTVDGTKVCCTYDR